ncbi:WXG100 family type VII secretion target [Actinokineospora globicatena]|uniref:WXG100 family type VII secretion target n=1 Tax=Actinokineospora globicatena TaxID=103729 RepID=UPI0020A54A27|nr:PPE domain-containing protein [Actinokineospora globicatena]MCP2301577.1 PPE family protein [Actinokineospora globicatena]GLW76771.1 hypothetical protein Aglo01_12530 [Actinokineospora globicatena]GLW83604.1 hypothetical protein Aglo02_12440 [Actinokineospora globicatena]
MAGHHAYSDDHEPTAKQCRDKEGRKRNKELDDFRQVNWDHYDHATLYNMVMKAEPGLLAERAGQWSDLSKRIAGTTGHVQNILQGLLGTWRGPAAKSAAESNTRLTQWAGEAAHTTDRIGEGLSNFAGAVIDAQQRMPEPVFYYAQRHFESGYDIKVDRDPSDAILLKALAEDQQPSATQHAEAKAKAVQVMKAFATESHDVRSTLPDYPSTAPAPRPGAPEPVPTITYTAMPEHEKWPPSKPPTTTTPPPEDPGGPGKPGGPDGPGVSHVPDSGTDVSNYNPTTSPTTGYGPGATGYGPGGSQSGGSVGGGFGGAFGGRTGSDAVPRGGALSGVGGLGGGRAGGGFAEGAPGRAGAAAGGMYPPMGGGAGAQGEEDSEHKNRYVEGMDFFDDLPPAYPPVFGA